MGERAETARCRGQLAVYSRVQWSLGDLPGRRAGILIKERHLCCPLGYHSIRTMELVHLNFSRHLLLGEGNAEPGVSRRRYLLRREIDTTHYYTCAP